MTPLEILRAARELLSERGRWTQEADARDAYGAEVGPLNASAVCWCAFGAVHRVADGDMSLEHAVTALEAELGRCHAIGPWNDAHDHADVLALFDRTIARLESKP